MTFDTALVLFLILLAYVVAHLVPKPGGFGKLFIWLALALLTLVLVLVGALHLVR